MTNIVAALKVEIQRIARKQVRADTESLKRAVSEHRRSIVALRKEVRDLAVRLRSTGRGGTTAAVTSAPDTDTVKRRFSASRLAAHRLKLGLSAADYGKLVGVTAQSIYRWELGISRPRPAQIAALAAVRALGKRKLTARLGSRSAFQ